MIVRPEDASASTELGGLDMALIDFVDIAALELRQRLVTLRGVMRVTAAASTLALGSLLAASPAVAAECKFASATQMNIDTGVEPQLLINGTCTDPVYNEGTFVIDKTEQLIFQVPGGPLIPYTQVTGHFPAAMTVAMLPAGVRQSPTTFQL